LVVSLQTYEYSLPSFKKANAIALKASKKKTRVLSNEDSNNEVEDAVPMLAKNFKRLMKNPRFKKKFSGRLKGDPNEAKPEEEKKDPRGPRCFECSGFRHIKHTIEISDRQRERLTTLLSVNLKKRRP
jgi:predicted adenine nucleotide alpha hydrolase (AANH) superfamily ATPase